MNPAYLDDCRVCHRHVDFPEGTSSELSPWVCDMGHRGVRADLEGAE